MSELINIKDIDLHDNNRKSITPESLLELQASIKSSGLLQPVLVRKKGKRFELIAGQRRFMACSGIDTMLQIPARVMEVKEFNQTNCPANSRALGLFLAVEARGVISLSKGLYNLLCFSETDGLHFYQDQKSLEDWYICNSPSKNAFPLTIDHSRARYRICSAVLVQQLIESINQKDKLKFRIDVKRKPVTIEGKDLYMLINSSVK